MTNYFLTKVKTADTVRETEAEDHGMRSAIREWKYIAIHLYMMG